MRQYVRETIVRITQSAELVSADGERTLHGDTAVDDITITLPVFAADEGPIEIRKVSASNTLSVALNGSTCNGHAGPVQWTGNGSAALLIPGTTEWKLLERIVIE